MSQAPSPPGAPPKPRTPIFLIVVAILVIFVVVIGVLAAVAIPSFVRYMRRSKAAEAETNVTAIVTGVQARFAERGSLPVSIPATPEPACGQRAWPPSASPAWAELSFAPVGPLRYAYSIDATQDGRSVWVRAVGDLDCDGVFGRFERSVTLAPDGSVQVGPLIRTDELE